jgi:hypothetical protein
MLRLSPLSLSLETVRGTLFSPQRVSLPPPSRALCSEPRSFGDQERANEGEERRPIAALASPCKAWRQKNSYLARRPSTSCCCSTRALRSWSSSTASCSGRRGGAVLSFRWRGREGEEERVRRRTMPWRRERKPSTVPLSLSLVSLPFKDALSLSLSLSLSSLGVQGSVVCRIRLPRERERGRERCRGGDARERERTVLMLASGVH